MTLEVLHSEFGKLNRQEQRAFLDKIIDSYQDKDEAFELIHALLEKVRSQFAPTDYGVSEEQTIELERRFTEVEQGNVELLEGKQVEEELIQKYGLTL